MDKERQREFKKTPKRTTEINLENTSRLLITALNESSKFFAEKIAAFEVPNSFYKTEERLREIGFTRFERLVLPSRALREDDTFWEGKVKSEPLFWKQLQTGNIELQSAILQEGLSLIDGRPKPDYQNGEQRYEDDKFMEDMIRELQRKGEIKRYSSVPDGSRFGRASLEIEQVILPELARAIGKDALGSGGRVVNNSYMIFNVVGNMRHPEWGDTNTREWFSDKFSFVHRLVGGDSDHGGLAHVHVAPSDSRTDFMSFRPRIDFSSKT